jgi:hypothetical protein
MGSRHGACLLWVLGVSCRDVHAGTYAYVVVACFGGVVVLQHVSAHTIHAWVLLWMARTFIGGNVASCFEMIFLAAFDVLCISSKGLPDSSNRPAIALRPTSELKYKPCCAGLNLAAGASVRVLCCALQAHARGSQGGPIGPQP